jgi:pimeloyl-ACP methyl ester carboxylesterase
MSVIFLERSGKPGLAYMYQTGFDPALPTVVFLHGFRSDMMGTKAEFLAQECEKRGQNYLRLDYSGHGQSDGEFRKGTIGLWLEDALDMIALRTKGRIIIVGSSMGGWIGLHAALQNQSRLAGFIGLAAAPDFTRWIREGLSPQQRETMSRQGFIEIENEYGPPYPITQNFLEDGETLCLLDSPIPLKVPVRLIQGMKDADVPYDTARKIADAVTGTDKQVYLRPDGDHRLSTNDDLALLLSLIDELSAARP